MPLSWNNYSAWTLETCCTLAKLQTEQHNIKLAGICLIKYLLKNSGQDLYYNLELYFIEAYKVTLQYNG